MIKLVYRTPGTAPSSLQLEGDISDHHQNQGDQVYAPEITLCKYCESSLEEIICKDAGEAIRMLDPTKINWIDVNGSADIATVRLLGEHFGLSPLTILDVVTSQRPKMEQLENGIFLITTMAYKNPNDPGVVEVEQLSLFFWEALFSELSAGTEAGLLSRSP